MRRWVLPKKSLAVVTARGPDPPELLWHTDRTYNPDKAFVQ